MSDQSLHNRIVRLAYENEALRPHLLPLLRGAKQSSYYDYKENKGEFERMYSGLSRTLKGMGFSPVQQLLSSGGSEDAWGSWVYDDGGGLKVSVKVSLPSSSPFADESRNPWEVYYMVAENNRRLDHATMKPKSVRALKRSFDKLLKDISEWV